MTLAKEIGDMLGKQTPKKTTPGWMLKLLGRVSLWVSYVTGKEPDLTPEKAMLITSQMLCNSQKAENELDYQAVHLRSMLEDCYQWMLSEELIGN